VTHSTHQLGLAVASYSDRKWYLCHALAFQKELVSPTETAWDLKQSQFDYRQRWRKKITEQWIFNKKFMYIFIWMLTVYTNSIGNQELYKSLKQISMTSNCHHVLYVNVQANTYIITSRPSLFSFIISTLCVSCSNHAYPSVFVFPKILFLHFSHSLPSFHVTYNLPSGTWISNFTGFKEGGRTLVCGAVLAKVPPFIGNLCKMELSNSKHMHSVSILRQFLAHSHQKVAKLHLLASPCLKSLVSWAITLCHG